MLIGCLTCILHLRLILQQMTCMVGQTRISILLLQCVLMSGLITTFLWVVVLLITRPSYALGHSTSHRSSPMLSNGHFALLVRILLIGKHSSLTWWYSCTLPESLVIYLFLTEHSTRASYIKPTTSCHFGWGCTHSTLWTHVASMLFTEKTTFIWTLAIGVI